jgi:hypothetical protein
MMNFIWLLKKNPHTFLHTLIKPQNKMGGDANMFRTSNVLREAELPDKPEVWPVLDMLSCSPI